MSGKRAKATRREEGWHPSATSSGWISPFWKSWKGGLVVVAVAAAVGASFVTPKLLDNKTASAAHTRGMKKGAGLPVGSDVPPFSERDIMTGNEISAKSIASHKTLLFFSEGVMCQACFEQIQGLEQVGGKLKARGIQLIGITPDPPSALEQAIGQFGITTPMIADENRNMSEAFNTLGQGMHADSPGHAFVLVEGGKVRWQRDYWLAPYETMFVEPAKLLKDIPST